MPRSLDDERTLRGFPRLTRTDDESSPGNKLTEDKDCEDKRSQLHPYSQSLTLDDVESCLRLETACFPPQERCTRDKFAYRFTKCGELCIGLFTSAEPDSPINQICTAETARPVYSGAPERKAVLITHAVSTKITNDRIRDEDMALPSSEGTEPSETESAHPGHHEHGLTVALHSLAVVPDYQHQGFGTTLMKAYIQRVQASGVAERIALLAHDQLVPFYESFGFECKGKSQVQFAGGGWNDMVLEL